MPGPPKDVEPRPLFRKLLERTRPSVVVDFPGVWEGSDGPPKIRIVVLRDDEYDDARMFARDKMRAKYGKSPKEMDTAGQLIEKDWITRYILARSLRYPEPIEGTGVGDVPPDWPVIFPDAEDVAKALHRDELDVLGAMYSDTQAKFGPIESNVHTQEEVSAWIKVIAEGSDALPLSRLPSLELGQLLQSSSERAYTLSVILASLRETLPPSLDALCESWHIGTSYYGEAAANAIATKYGPSLSGKGEPLEYDEQRPQTPIQRDLKPIEPISKEDAARLAREMGRIAQVEPDDSQS